MNLSNAIYHLPKPKPQTPKRSHGYTLRFTPKEREAIALIAQRVGVSIADLLRSYVEYGMKMSVEELKGQIHDAG